MAASRKLQGEIDRCLKKVQEGVETFEDIWQKVHNATNTNQKEKYEADLKKEIKKLQRLRDQIKSWIASAEIKDKSILLDNRKLIETQMERFKVVERETKTKTFSKEGLGAAQKLDPAAREKEEISNWLCQVIDKLGLQADAFESEIEQILANKKKKLDKDKQDRLDSLKDLLERHRFHVRKLETLLRMLDNLTIDVDQIKNVREDVNYYLEECQNPGFEENQFLYDDIDMSDDLVPSEVSGIGDGDLGETPISTPSGSSPAPSPAINNNHSSDSSTTDEKRKAKPGDESHKLPVKPTAVKPPTSSSTSSTVSMAISNSGPALGLTTPNTSSVSSAPVPNSSHPLPKSATSTPVKSQVPPSAASQSTPNNSSPSSGFFGSIANGHIENGPVPQSQGVTMASIVSQQSGLTAAAIVASNLPQSSQTPQRPSTTPLSTVQLQAVHPVSATNTNITQQKLVNSLSLDSGSAPLSTVSSAPSSSPLPHPVSPPTPSTTPGTLSSLSQQSTGDTSGLLHMSLATLRSLPGGVPTSMPMVNGPGPKGQVISDAMSSLKSIAQEVVDKAGKTGISIPSIDSANAAFFNRNSTTEPSATRVAHIPPLLGVSPLGPVPLQKEHQYQYQMLESAYFHLPHPSDSERLRHYLPRNPCHTPPYYPQAMLPGSDTVEFFQRLPTETLFFIFYYMEGTKAQYLAARALKKQSWRFHTKYMMWFQRHEEPKTITEEYEQGTYIYFDYEKWGQRKKEGFTFEYKYLEDRDLN
ncbi:CCR4-NOT transcription complex subunit 3-like isoform X2 [Artemia franciscana]|uniref:CCR4-NOT transcription complex subunit 3 n=1 Tax=Artemia franciscana TaxID=6661 RepID=A0AA88L8X7_ARTSF|nr:hypothetical protein QYM36_007315 [Artemia franciscana]